MPGRSKVTAIQKRASATPSRWNGHRNRESWWTFPKSTESSFSIANKHLADRAFMLGDRPTIVDFSLAGYVYYPSEETGFDIAAEYPALDAWRQRLAALPGWKPPYDLMPFGSDLRTTMLRPA